MGVVPYVIAGALRSAAASDKQRGPLAQRGCHADAGLR